MRTATVLAGVLCAAISLGACSSTPSTAHPLGSGNSTTDPTTAVDMTIITAWRAAETAFYESEASPNGLSSPALGATMVDPELRMVRANLAGNQTENFVGRGTWNLGSPLVVSLEPTENQPTTATVASCIDDMQILVNENTGQPASGLSGTPDWAGETSTMVLTSSGWKLSQQSSVANTKRSVACAGISF
jgi:hypothetical protein